MAIQIGCLLILITAGLLETSEAEPTNFQLGEHVYKTCREDNATFTWQTPENETIFVIDLTFIPIVQNNDSNARHLIFNKIGDNNAKVDSRYTGRLTFTPKGDKLEFKLINVNPKDRGRYELKILTAETYDNYDGAANLTVYAEDNLWPLGESEQGQEPGEVEVLEEKVYSYPFIKMPDSPVIGIRMGVPATSVDKSCYFLNSSRCEIVFTSEELTGLSGTVKFEVTPLFEADAIVCLAVKMPYDYKISIMQAKLSSTLIGGICISVFVAIAACVIPPVIIYIKNRREKYIPLKGGHTFLRGCIERIEDTPDISDVYRKNANAKMIHPHVKGYFQDTKEAREIFFQDEGLTKIYFAAFIKYYISNVCEPLIPLEYIHKIKHEEKERFEIEEIKADFCIKKKDHKKTKYRKRMLKLLFHHFLWFRQRKIAADGSDSEENSPTKILTITALAGILAMTFDRTNPSVDMEEFDRLAKLTRFIKNVIINTEEIFGSREEANGNITASLDFTLDPLLDSSA